MPRTKGIQQISADDLGKRLEAIVKAIHTIRKLKKSQGIIECPICKGILSYSYVNSDGKTSGNCQTEGCINWKQ